MNLSSNYNLKIQKFHAVLPARTGILLPIVCLVKIFLPGTMNFILTLTVFWVKIGGSGKPTVILEKK
jgi:hypothetical protein